MNPTETIQSTATAAFTRVQPVAYQLEYFNQNFDSTCNKILHHVFLAAKEANESYTFKEMACKDDCDEFVVVMRKESEDHMTRNKWEVILRSDMPKDSKMIMEIWSFKRKGFLTEY